MRRAKISLACAVVVSVIFAMDNAPKGLHGRRTALAQAPAARTPAADFFVSPQGNDRWSGRLADPGENDGPFDEGKAIGDYGSRHEGRDVCAFDHNLYWSASGQPVLFGKQSLVEWRAAGQDKDSIIADPLFVDPAHGDFHLRPGSPAAQIGFEPWDLATIGPRPQPAASKRDSTDVPRWGRFETVLHNDRSYRNPFADVVLNASFTSPSGRQVAFFGFHDGDGQGGQTGNVWKLRFMPDEIGVWSFHCAFSDGAPGTNGTFGCVAAGATPGPLRVDSENRRCWVFADGSHFSARAFTAPELFVAGSEAHWKFWIAHFFGGNHKFNLCNANLLNFVGTEDVLNWQGTPYRAPDPAQPGKFIPIRGNGLFPFLHSGPRPRFDGGSNVDWLRPSVRCWANVDRVLGELEIGKAVWFNHWGMIGWDWSGNGRLLVPAAARKPVLRYWIARLAPYWNVTWNLAGEWDELLTPAEFDELGNFIKPIDPWNHPKTSHALATTADRPWVDFRVQQFAAGTSSESVTNAKRALADYAQKPVFAFETSWEGRPGKLTADQVRTGAWGSLMGGAFYLYAECFEPALTWGDGDAFPFVEIMNDFLYDGPYWRLSPNAGLVNSGSLCLADPGQRYVIYRQTGGTMTIDLSGVSGVFHAEWLNPRTGAKTPAEKVEGGARRSFASPDGNDWVLHLTRKDNAAK